MYRAKADDLPCSASSHCENLDMASLSQKVKLNATKKETFFWDESLMENKTFKMRRSRLVQWMSLRHLSQTDVASRTGKTRSYVSQILKGGKSFGEKMARHIEDCLHMEPLWLDGEVDEPKAAQDFSELANLLASTFDALDMDEATKRDAFVAASQTLISFAARRRLPASYQPETSVTQATPSNEAQKQPLLGSNPTPSKKTRLGQ